MNSSRDAESPDWLTRLLWASVVLAGALAMSLNVADADLWGHVQYGRDALREGMHWTTTYSFTAHGYRWINHENLSELTLALLADRTGPRGLLLAKFLLGATVVVVVMRSSLRSGAGLIVTVSVALLLAVNIASYWTLRPQLFSFAGYTALLVLLGFVFHDWNEPTKTRGPDHASSGNPTEPEPALGRLDGRWKWLFLAAPLIAAWTNTHGAFVAGLGVFLAYLGCRSLEALSVHGRGGLRHVGWFALAGLAAAAATLVNPYGLGLHRWLWESLGQPRPEVTEWHPPDLLSLQALPLWLLITSFLVVMATTSRHRDLTHSVILLITLWASLRHHRHIPFFALAFAFWMPLHLQSVMDRFLPSRRDPLDEQPQSLAARRAILAGFCLALGLLSFRTYQRLSELRVDRSLFPVSALQYMADQRLHGNLVVTFNWAQYAIAAFNDRPGDGDSAGMRVAFDGRYDTCYPPEVIVMHFDFILGDLGEERRWRGQRSPPFAGDRVLETGQEIFGKPNLALICRSQPHSERMIRRRQGEWSLLYQDGLAQLWGRRSWYDDTALSTYIPESARSITENEQTGSVTWPALPIRRPSRTELASLREANP